MVRYLAALILTAGLLAGCTESPEAPAPESLDTGAVERALISERRARIGELTQSLPTLETAIEVFLGNPTDATLDNARNAWRDAHLAFASYRFFVANPDDLFRIDTWPIMTGFIDHIEGYPDSGLIHDETITIDEATLIAQHGITDNEEAALGFHPLGFLLFTRTVDEFVEGEKGERRREMVRIVTARLIADIRALPVPSYAVSRTEDAPDDYDVILLDDVTSRLLTQSQSLFGEATRFDAGHGVEPGVQQQTMTSQLQTMSHLVGTGTPLSAIYTGIDPVAAADLSRTIGMTLDLLSAETLDDEAKNSLTLMCAAITHQVEDLARAAALKYPVPESPILP